MTAAFTLGPLVTGMSYRMGLALGSSGEMEQDVLEDVILFTTW